MLGANSSMTANFSNSSCLGANSVISSSNQIMLGTSAETVNLKGGLVNSFTVISSTTTLTNPLPINILCTNGGVINITIPSPPDGTKLYVRRLVGSSTTVNLLHASFVPAGSQTPQVNLVVNISASFIFYTPSWYCEYNI